MKYTLISMISMLTFIVLFTIQLQSMKIIMQEASFIQSYYIIHHNHNYENFILTSECCHDEAFSDAESPDDLNFEKRAYHFFRLKKSERCLRIPDSVKQMILREPYIVCPEDREFLGL
ncbi:hypothetical protein MS3_00009177 [Schistosoma haematobium]|uniref:Uncharacterized protein n=1 Tax=Schistosoma haematobium TaxID=6185 RepID=A0A094ZQA1_SCHHA|nr:hypothetical protein MS3_00009177 [Schistosoma haematobium]KAH9580567.1 hypothetical protein MS3_00009177 [Schistosoma haematobium]